MSEPRTYEDGYRDGYVSGYTTGAADGRAQGYVDAKYRAHAAVAAVDIPRLERTKVSQALVENVGKLTI